MEMSTLKEAVKGLMGIFCIRQTVLSIVKTFQSSFPPLPNLDKIKAGGKNRKRLFFITDIAAVFTLVFQDRYFLFFPPPFAHTAHSPSLRLPSRSNPRPHFPKQMESDVTSVRLR